MILVMTKNVYKRYFKFIIFCSLLKVIFINLLRLILFLYFHIEFNHNQFGGLLHQGQFAKLFKYVDQCSFRPHFPQLLHFFPFEPFTGRPVNIQT
jgi:hypothetical protein